MPDGVASVNTKEFPSLKEALSVLPPSVNRSAHKFACSVLYASLPDSSKATKLLATSVTQSKPHGSCCAQAVEAFLSH